MLLNTEQGGVVELVVLVGQRVVGGVCQEVNNTSTVSLAVDSIHVLSQTV